jgi:hypothetical protein
MLLELQRAFRRTVTGRDDALTDYVVGQRRRIAVYRNTVQKGLVDVLAVAFPAVKRIVGEGFFLALARDFVIHHQPQVPQLSRYGADFADFIAAHDKTQALPYLPDVARLEWARGEAYFAADAAPLDPAALAAVPMDRLSDVKLVPHPAARLIRSRFPVHRIWSVNQPEVAEVPEVDMSVAEDVLITRPLYEVIVRLISPADATFVSSCIAGGSLGEATVAGLSAAEDFDLQSALQEHFFKATFAAIN